MTANLILKEVTSDGTTSTWEDQSVYTTPARNTLALDFSIFKVDEDQVESALSFVTFNPKTVTEFTNTNTIDGWYKVYFVIVRDWLVGTTYNRYDLVWSPTQNKFYEYINVTPSAGNVVTNATYFAEVTQPSLKLRNLNTATPPGNLEAYQVLGTILTFNTSVCFSKAVAAKCKEGCDCDGDCGCESKLAKLSSRLEDLITTMELDSLRGLYVEGERAARLADKYCDDCGCSSR